MTEASLEERLVLATVTVGSTPNTIVTVVAPLTAPGVTPPPASPPFTPGVTAARRGLDLTVAQLRAAYRQQFRAAMTDLRKAIQADIRQLQANGSVPTTQQQADLCERCKSRPKSPRGSSFRLMGARQSPSIATTTKRERKGSTPYAAGTWKPEPRYGE